jgi:hypothetical protein
MTRARTKESIGMVRTVMAFLALALLVIGCAGADDAPKLSPPAWLNDTQIQVLETRPSFDGNVEVVLALHNQGMKPLIITDLARDGAVRVRAGEDNYGELHPLSVGVAKPIKLRSRERLRTSLLFKPTRGAPTALVVYDRTYAFTQLSARKP